MEKYNKYIIDFWVSPDIILNKLKTVAINIETKKPTFAGSDAPIYCFQFESSLSKNELREMFDKEEFKANWNPERPFVNRKDW